MPDAKERLKHAVQVGDTDALAALLDRDAHVAAVINEPIGPFGARALHMATADRATLDVLLDHGADPNLGSDWSEGPFTVLDSCDEPTVRHLLTRGATLTPHVAARLGWVDELREMLAADPHVNNQRGGDGKRPLHWAGNVAVVDLLLDAGADIDARCTDHLSTPLQYAVADRPDVAWYLLERGATPDIFATVALGDTDRTRRQLQENPQVTGHRIGHDGYNRVPSCTIYQWTRGYGKSPLDLATDNDDMRTLLSKHADEKTRFLAAATRGDRDAALAFPRPALTDADHALLGDIIRRGDLNALLLMLELGFDPTAPYPGLDHGTALHVAAWLGNINAVRLLLDDGRVTLETRDPVHGSTVLGWACHGAVHCGPRDPAYVEIVQLLMNTGADPTDQDAAGRPDVQAVLGNGRSD